MPNVINLSAKQNGERAVTTEDLFALVNDERTSLGEPKAKYADFLTRVIDELSDDQKFNGDNFSVQKLSNNTERKIYDLTLEQATLVGMRESKGVRRAILRKLKELESAYADPPRAGLLQDKRKSMWDMTDALKEIRAELGKGTEAKHYMCENKLINWCIAGKFAKLDEKSLSNEDVEVCRKLRVKNAAYIRADMEYAERKVKLREYAQRLRSIKLLT